MSLPQSSSLKNEKSLKIPTGSRLITTLGHVFFLVNKYPGNCIHNICMKSWLFNWILNLDSLGTKLGNKQKSNTINDVPIIKHKSAWGQSSRIISSNRVGISSPKNVISGLIQAGWFDSGQSLHFIGSPVLHLWMHLSLSLSFWQTEHRNLSNEPCA